MFKISNKFKGHFGNILSDSVIYGLGTVISRFISVFLLPLYTSQFLPKDYAILSLVSVSMMLMSMFSGLSLDSAAALYFHKADNETEKKSYYSTWYFFEQSLALLIGVVFLLFRSNFNVYLGKGFSNYQYLPFLCVAILGLSVFQRVTFTWLRSQRKLWMFTTFSLSNALLTILFNYIYVIHLKIGIIGMFLGQLSALTISVVISLVLLNNFISFKLFSKDKLKKMLRFSLPLIPSAIFAWLLSSSGTYFLEADRTELGLFQFGSSLSAIAAVPIMAFNQSYPNYAFSIVKHENSISVYRKVLYLYFIVFAVYIALIGFIMPWVVSILANNNYQGVYIPSMIMATYHFIAGGWQIGSLGLNFAEDNKPIAQAIFIGGTVNFILLFLLDKSSNSINVGIAMAISQFVILMYILYKSERAYPMNTRLLKIVVPIVLLATCIFMFWKYNT